MLGTAQTENDSVLLSLMGLETEQTGKTDVC